MLIDCNGQLIPQQPTTQDKTNFNTDVNKGLESNAPFNAATLPSDDRKNSGMPTTRRFTPALEGRFPKIRKFLKLVLSWVGRQQISNSICKVRPIRKHSYRQQLKDVALSNNWECAWHPAKIGAWGTEKRPREAAFLSIASTTTQERRPRAGACRSIASTTTQQLPGPGFNYPHKYGRVLVRVVVG